MRKIPADTPAHLGQTVSRSAVIVRLLGWAFLAASLGLGVYVFTAAWPHRYESHTRLVLEVDANVLEPGGTVADVISAVTERLAHSPTDFTAAELPGGRVELLLGHDESGRERLLARLREIMALEEKAARRALDTLLSPDPVGKGPDEQAASELRGLLERTKEARKELLPMMVRLNLRSTEDVLWLLGSEGRLSFHVAAMSERAGGAGAAAVPVERAESLCRQLQEQGPFRTGRLGWYELFGDDLRDALSGTCVVRDYAGKSYILLYTDPNRSMASGGQPRPWRVVRAECVVDEPGAGLCIQFELDEAGGERLRELTASHRGQRLAVVLDDVCYAAPAVESAIGRHGVVQMGNASFQEAARIAAMLGCTPRRPAVLLPPAEAEFRQESLYVWQPWPGVAALGAGACGLVGLIALLLGTKGRRREP
jgi:hypothetical protein